MGNKGRSCLFLALLTCTEGLCTKPQEGKSPGCQGPSSSSRPPRGRACPNSSCRLWVSQLCIVCLSKQALWVGYMSPNPCTSVPSSHCIKEHVGSCPCTLALAVLWVKRPPFSSMKQSLTLPCSPMEATRPLGICPHHSSSQGWCRSPRV